MVHARLRTACYGAAGLYASQTTHHIRACGVIFLERITRVVRALRLFDIADVTSATVVMPTALRLFDGLKVGQRRDQ